MRGRRGRHGDAAKLSLKVLWEKEGGGSLNRRCARKGESVRWAVHCKVWRTRRVGSGVMGVGEELESFPEQKPALKKEVG